ncbi:helix-turn-helix domain-containing protein [Mumia quercus]|uniref:PucR family transcriptional regulator n=1 Tax=Mumia quercus TaxID=2976125 RepID=UPI0021D35BD4|nr:helix-turn-helix domain-containing protein [Mumia quercus]
MIEAGAGQALSPGEVPPGVVNLVKPTLDDLVERITAKIQREVPSFAGSTTGRRSKLISTAATGAISHFLDMVLGKPSSTGARVDDLFRRMGYAEASDGHSLTALRESLQLAGREAWAELRAIASKHNLSADVLGKLGDDLFGYLDHLADQATTGYDAARRARDSDIVAARRRLLDGLLDGVSDAAEIDRLAANAAWVLAPRVVVLSADAPDGTELPDLAESDAPVLARTSPSPAVYVCSVDDSVTVLALLRDAIPTIRIAASWKVSVGDVADARRWTVRALDLSDKGIISEEVIECAKYRTMLWLHSEPALRRQMAQELLVPLFAETPNSREILSETLLDWLQTRDSAPAIAGRLGVHAQTVRYRWKRINELFGEALHDPEFIVQLTMVLKASVPLWIAGDQSDFERFRSEDPT